MFDACQKIKFGREDFHLWFFKSSVDLNYYHKNREKKHDNIEYSVWVFKRWMDIYKISWDS